jgi:hypothetical protein
MSTSQVMPARITNETIESYLRRLEAALGGVPASDKEDIVREIRAHIVDSTTGSSDRHGAVDRVLRMLGTPEDLAQRYATECLLSRAGRSFSPWLLLRTSWRWAKMGAKGTVAFMVAFTGYATALAFTISIFMKPFVPTVGLWIGPRTLEVGTPGYPAEMHELLGQWFVPVLAVAAFLIAAGTTQALRWMIRKRTSESVGLRGNVSATSAV